MKTICSIAASCRCWRPFLLAGIGGGGTDYEVGSGLKKFVYDAVVPGPQAGVTSLF